MKPLYLTMSLIMFFSMLLFPLASLKSSVNDPPAVSGQAAGGGDDGFRVYFRSEDKTEYMSTEDYIYCVVAAEMPAEYGEEALKAQSVASYTYACYKRAARRAAGEGFDVIADGVTEQAFMSPNELNERWGDRAAEYENKIKSAIAEVSGYILTYDSQPAMTVFHAVSSGKTESAETVWGKALPYLTPVESVGDLLSPEYLSEARFGIEEFAAAAAALPTTLTDGPESWISAPECSDSGTVVSMRIGDKYFTGGQVRAAFSLRSANFDLNYADGEFVFAVRGWGHDVGMSQYGANHMAEQGSGYAEILNRYYPGCILEKIDIAAS